ncbi:hypothetical protein [Mycetocola zhadangensis]|uniref:Di-and tripeptidase n=1 Tax=Mycetocola zhadangensis TaxID=1164595 RepID=A0A3L7JB77_9MICO|nr:hypothetical protein [Mycetocola zhadangensis]RLQ85752.1 hypothetical protein D9V28_02490 [Mycetocola zhadangensis]GGE85487.1 hypothetical protein GCM10011313_04920 [Mycetocola zhadangensis]
MKTQSDRIRIVDDAEFRSDPVDPTHGPLWLRGVDRALSVQRPVVVAHIRGLRRQYPGATPDQLVRVLERRYLTAITSGGAAVGATAMVPGVGTGITIALSGAETLGFLETTALFAQSVAEVHGIAVDDPVRARALVMTLMLGKSGIDLVKQFTGQAFQGGPPRNRYWGQLVASSVPQAVMGPVADDLKRRFLKHFAVNQGSSFVGKALPFGIGAAIGGIGNHLAGKQVILSSRNAFGPAPLVLPLELEPRDRSRTPSRTMRALRERMPSRAKSKKSPDSDPGN